MLDLSQVLALVIFVALFAAIIVGKVHRYVPALVAALLTILVVFLLVMRRPEAVASVLSLDQIAQRTFWFPGREHIEGYGVNWQTIIFIAGMMAMVEGMGGAGFFNWLCLSVAKLVKYRVVPIFVGFTLVSGFLSMFIGSITVLLFMTAVVIELARVLKLDPVPLIIAMIFAANTRGSTTLAGDPPNIIIGTSLGYTFGDFLVNTGVVAWIGILVALGFFYLVFRKSLVSGNEAAAFSGHYPDPAKAVADPFLFKVNSSIFLLTCVLLITHATTGLSVALIGVIGGGLSLAVAPRHATRVMKALDWRTLLFFVGLFVTVGGLEETGVLERLSQYIGDIARGNHGAVAPVILWLSAAISALVDNIPFAAAMVPVISGVAQTAGIALAPLAWALALGTDIGGNATPIGASANVVGTAIAEKQGYRITWGRYMKYAVPATVLVVGLCWGYLVLRYR